MCLSTCRLRRPCTKVPEAERSHVSSLEIPGQCRRANKPPSPPSCCSTSGTTFLLAWAIWYCNSGMAIRAFLRSWCRPASHQNRMFCKRSAPQSCHLEILRGHQHGRKHAVLPVAVCRKVEGFYSRITSPHNNSLKVASLDSPYGRSL